MGPRYDNRKPGLSTARANGPDECTVVQAGCEYRTPCSKARDHDGDHDWDYSRTWAVIPYEER